MPAAHEMLQPVVALAAWTMVMWAWMYATRLPAILGSKMVLDPNRPRGEQMAELPAKVRWKADNYNHLMEQPTVFYAVGIALALANYDRVDQVLAWTYVGIRVAHSVLQASINKIEIRFVLFLLSSLVLVALTIRAALAIF
jgi:hypothetical protein